MDQAYSRISTRERILNDLRNIVKQIYHESVNNELSCKNKTYICMTLIKNLDEALRHGLKQLHLGYWKPICEILHPETLQSVEKLPVYNKSETNGPIKGRAWIALALTEDSFVNYVQCLVSETCLDKFYEDWSILRSNDSCNRFLSILSGLDNILFTFELDYLNNSPRMCNFKIKAESNEENSVIKPNLTASKSSLNLAISTSSLVSPVDSGVHIQDSTSDMEQLSDYKEADIDILNGNVPETVLLRKEKKNSKRHVSFHEDIIYKSPEKCRQLKWDLENIRYSWSGEQIDSSILKKANFCEIKLSSSTPVNSFDINERGTPEGEETPADLEQIKQINKSQKSIIVKRFLQSIKNQSKTRYIFKKFGYTKFECNFRKVPVDKTLIAEINDQIKRELKYKPNRLISKNEVKLHPSVVKEMMLNQSIYKTFRLRDYLFIITSSNIFLVNSTFLMKIISFANLRAVVVYPDSQVFALYESDRESHFITGDAELTNEILGKLEYSMRRNQYNPPQVHILQYEDFSIIKKCLIENLAIEKKEDIIYCGLVYLDKENDLLNSMLPSSKRGFLMFRNHQTKGAWIPGDFYLKNGILYLFGEDTSLPKLAVNVATGCQSCNRTKNMDRPHTFQITLVESEVECNYKSNEFYDNNFIKSNPHKPGSRKLMSGIRKKFNKLFMFEDSNMNSSCVLEFAAANECELSEWLQMIIHASYEDPCEEAHKEHITEGMMWVTSKTLTITNEIWTSKADLEILSCAQLQDVAAIRIGDSEKDFFTVIEFTCMEANSTSGDWIVYMHSREELMKLIFTLRTLWKSKENFPCENLEEGSLLNRCKKSQESLFNNPWISLLQ